MRTPTIPTTDKSGRLFSTEHLSNGLKARTVQSAAITAVAQGMKFIIQLTSIAMFARLLNPADFGLVAMVTVLTGLLAKFKDGGLSMATIQRPIVTHGQISNLFWVNAGLGLMLSVVSIAISPVLAYIYAEPRLTLICMAMSTSFLIGGLSVQHEALLRRQMQFKALAMIDVVSMACGVLAGIISAWGGSGYWALVVMPVTTAIFQTALAWAASEWRPGLPKKGTGVRPLLNFGASLTGASFVGYVASNVTPFTVGLVGGAQPLGFFNRANTLAAMPLSQIMAPLISVAQPALSRVAGDQVRFKGAVLSLTRKICLLSMFVSVTMAVTADWIVSIFLGPGWDEAVVLIRLLAVFSVVEPVATLAVVALVAAGKADAMLRWKLVEFAIILISIAIGTHWGALGVVAAYSLSGVFVRLPLLIAYLSRKVPIPSVDLFGAFLPFLFLSLVVLTALVAIRLRFDFASSTEGLFVLLPVAAGLYLLLGIMVKTSRLEIVEIHKTIWKALGRPNHAA